MNDLLDQLQVTDPDFARTVKRLRRVSVALAVAIGVALFAGTYAIIINGQQDTQIKRIEKRSACETNAASYDCQHTKQEASRAASTYTTCISFLKVGYPCPKPNSGITIKPSEKEMPCQCSKGGGALQPGSSGHQQTGPPSSGPPGGTGQPPESSEPSEPTHEPPPKPKSGLLSPVIEGVCTTVDHLAELC
jgi:hypothetical protein